MTAPLSGIRILEVSSGFAARFCGRLLEKHGATVTRLCFPSAREIDQLTQAWLDEGKNIQVAPPEFPIRAGDGQTLLEKSDAVILDLHPNGDRGSWDPQSVASAHKDLVIASITPFGETGPWRNHKVDSFTLDALSGTLSIRGPIGRAPPVLPRFCMELGGALNAYVGMLAALIRRDAGLSQGEVIDISLFESAISSSELIWSLYAYQGVVPTRQTNRGGPGLGMMECQDGYLMPFLWGTDNWQAFAALIGDESFTEFAAGVLARDQSAIEHARRRSAGWFSSRTKSVALFEGQELQLPFGSSFTIKDLLDDPQLSERGAFAPTAIAGRQMLMPESRLVREPATTVGGRPNHDEHDDRPLAGIVIVDLTSYWAGPVATRLLADLGAKVIKVEGPARPDPTRIQMPKDSRYTAADKWERGWWNGLNVGKNSLVVELTNTKGRRLLDAVLTKADVLVENLSLRVVENLSLRPEDLRQSNRNLDVVSMSAFGRTGPYKQFVAFGISIEPMSGVNELTGYPDLPPEDFNSILADPLSGLAGAAAVLTILVQRLRTGLAGHHVDIAAHEILMNAIAWAFAEYQLTGSLPVRNGNQRTNAYLSDCFRCKGDDQFVAISCETREEWTILSDLLGLDSEPTLAPIAEEARRATDVAIANWCSNRTKMAAFEELQGLGLIAAPVLDVRELFENRHLAERNFYRTITTAAGFPQLSMTPGFRFTRQPLRLENQVPRFGQHNRDVLEWAGVDPDVVSAAIREGVVADAPTATFPGIVQPDEAETR